ncbi:hypothetical protein [Methanobrevibacter sp.]|uniref:hypothetical protein n=1 Tax=Methanobrevibacter sp. TaxID=66852 RepID=UPI00388D4A03
MEALKIRKLYLLGIILIIFISISCVSASDNTNTTQNMGSDISIDNISIPGTYDDLNTDIQNLHSGDVYNITKDYKFDSKGQTIILQDRIIVISQDNIVINGNGFTIDAGGSQNFAIFKVLGNNVTINNLKFANSEPSTIMGPTIFDNCRYQKVLSPICWEGNDGTIENCNFYNNCAVNGGSISWTGNNGKIDNCQFINSTARGVGGALYIGGANNTISNCIMINSTSQLSGEAVYIDRNRKNITFTNFTCPNELQIIDGVAFNIDVNYLFYSYKIPVWGNISTGNSYELNVIPLIYKSIVCGGLNNIDDDFNYFAQYFNETDDFILNFAAYEEISDYVYLDKFYKDMLNFKIDWIESFHIDMPSPPVFHFGFDYLKSMSFSNITDFNQIFDCVLHENYKFSLTQNLIGFVHDVYDYSEISSVDGWDQWFDTDKGTDIFVNNFEVIFTDKITAASDVCWRPNISGFDSIIIMGNGSTIDGNSKDDHGEKKWVEMAGDPNTIFAAYDLTVKNFNTAVECFAGQCYFNNVRFDSNRMDYTFERDWGAAIINTGVIICDNCTFAKNYAKNGGAIFNQGHLFLNNCTFRENTAYGKGDNVCVGEGGHTYINGKNILSDTSIVYIAESISIGESTIMCVLAIALTITAAIAATVVSGNPFVGAAVGGVVGTVMGLSTAGVIISETYDANYDRTDICLCGVIVGASIGMLSGILACEVSINIGVGAGAVVG